jgi:hypothetical protein
MLKGQATQAQKILILAAIPQGLRLDREIRSVDECIRRAVRRDMFEVGIRTAVRPQDIRRALAEEKPHIVHFCGHGLEDGSLLLEDDGGNDKAVSPEGLASLFELHADYVDCVLLNACHSVKSAEAISQYINYTIGMNQEIQDKSAIQFAQGFYDGLGYATPEDRDVFPRAFQEGKVAIKLENLSQAQIPVLKIKINKTAKTSSFETARRTDKPFQAPPLPTHYVDRPEYSQDLKTRLLAESNDVRTLVVTAIHGLGSVGKSTLATALAHAPQVQAHFCDGILWATLGQQPDVLSLLSGWIQALGDYNFKPTSIEAATNHLRTLLYDKAVLLVVDDAWETKHAQAFNIGGSRCQVLVTTREGAIADALGASTYSLDVMKPSQAMELLTKKLGRDLKDSERQSATDLALAVGYLPLALELAAAEIANGTSWVDLLQDLQLEVARLKTFDRPESEEITDEASLKRLSLTASLNLSVQRLSKEKQLYFSWLGVLPEDATITKAMTATLWEMNERDASKMLQYLRNKALLLTGVSLDGTPTYRLHDLFHDLARNLLTAPEKPKDGELPGLSLTLVDAHGRFLERYREKTKNGQWHTLPDDGYIHERLSWHLEQAQKTEEIHSLLQEETESGRNGWYEACDRLGQTAIFVTDVARAWQLAEDSWSETTQPQVIGLQCRYALIIASLNSLTANVPVKLLIALVQKNVWTPEQGLAYVLQSSNPEKKANLLTQLGDRLPPNLKELALSEALVAAKQIPDEYYRVDALSTLADKLPEVLSEALAAAKLIQDEFYRAKALSALVDKLPPELLSEALATAKLIQDEFSRADALSALVDKLPPELLTEALAAAKLIQDESARADALSALADKLPPELLTEALAAAKLIQSDGFRAYALSALADKLPPELLSEALAAAKLIQFDEFRAQALSALADKLPEVLPDALAAAKQIQSEYHRAFALSALADKLPEVLPDALAAAKLIQSDEFRAQALSALADKLPPELLSEALATTKQIQSDEFRAQALSALADKLSPELLSEALAAAKQIQDESNRALALIALADKLPPELLSEALATAKLIQYEHNRAKVLSALADKLPELLSEALAATKQIHSESDLAQALSALTDKLPPELLSEALAAAKLIQDEFSRAKALSALAKPLSEMPTNLLFPVWKQTLHELSFRTRQNLLTDIKELVPVIEALGGQAAIASVGYAIQKVTRWWH